MITKIKEASVPFLTTAQMVEVDRAMIEDYRILLIQMMENAGRNLAHLARVRFLTTGSTFDPVVRATATMTLALPKEGLRVQSVRTHVGELYLADISVPPELYAEPALRLQVSALFSQSDIVQVV